MDTDTQTDDLAAIAEALDDLDAARGRLDRAVAAARAAGWTWELIAVPLGVTRQAARQRFVGKVQ